MTDTPPGGAAPSTAALGCRPGPEGRPVAADANPINDGDVFANVATPLIQQHNVAAGLSRRIAANVDMSLAYVYLVNNDVSGPLPAPPFPAGSTMNNEISAHSVALGVTVRY